MKSYKIPQTDLETSRIAYGTWHLGGGWDNEPPTQAIKDRAAALIHAAVEHGITLIDLADIYTRGKSDQVVGEAIKNTPSLRDKVLLQEKCGIRFGDVPNPGDPGRYDFSYDHIIHSVESCLGRLHTDYVDLLLLHRPDPLIRPEEVARAFDDLVTSGKVRYFGVSNHTGMQIELLKKYVSQPLVINQIELNLLHNDLITDGIYANSDRARYTGARDILDYCRVNNIMVQAWSPLAGGNLFAPAADAPSTVKSAAQAIARLAEKHKVSGEAIALAWLLHHPAQIQPILGTKNIQRLVDSVSADKLELTREEWYGLLAAATGAGVP